LIWRKIELTKIEWRVVNVSNHLKKPQSILDIDNFEVYRLVREKQIRTVSEWGRFLVNKQTIQTYIFKIIRNIQGQKYKII